MAGQRRTASTRGRQPKRNTRQLPPARRALPGWALALGGLAVGIIGAGLFFLSWDERTPGTAPAPTEQGPPAPTAPPPAAPPGQADTLQFDFYDQLPEQEVVIPGSTPPAADDAPAAPASPQQPQLLQVGAFRRFEDADAMKAQLALLGVEVKVERRDLDNGTWYRVRTTPITDPVRLQRLQRRLQDNGIETIALRAE